VNATVLVADDDPFNLRLLQELCEAAGYRVLTAEDGGAVLAVVARERPDLVLLDLHMPEKDGFEVLATLKSDPELGAIPVVIVTALGDAESRARGIELGAEDYVTKPFRVFEIQQRIRNSLRLSAAEHAMKEAEERARQSELIDPLTRTGTSAQLLVTLDYEYTRAERYGHELTIMLLRIVNYTELVGATSIETGEGALIQLAAGLRASIRAIDHLFRSDLEEFTIVLPETGVDGANIVRARVVDRHNDGTLWSARIEPQPQLAFGLACFPHDAPENASSLLRTAVSRLNA
jgi:two-component system, cell cycle response regulator